MFVAFDVETTGLESRRDRIVEIGAVRFDRDGIHDTFEQLVNPGRPIPPQVTAIHGLTDADVAASPPIQAVLPQIIKFFGDSVLVAHNAPFDTGFFETSFGDAGLEPLQNPILCSRDLSRALFPDLPDYKLTTLVTCLSIPEGEHHRGVADAIYCYEVFRRCVERMNGSWDLSFHEIAKCGGPLVRFGMSPVRVLEAVQSALSSGSSIRVEYQAGNGKITSREITPKGIENRGRYIKVVAHCHLRNEKRTFRLDGIKRIL